MTFPRIFIKLGIIDVFLHLTGAADSPIIGFMVNYHSSTDVIVGNTHEVTVPFNKILWNDGNGYDVRRHTFTAPTSGLYAFHVNGLSGYGHGCIWLIKNSAKQTTGWASQKHSTVHISAGLRLLKGDKIWVNACLRSTVDNDTGVSFSGYMVRSIN